MMNPIEMDVHDLEHLGELIADVYETLSDDLPYVWLEEIEGYGTPQLELDDKRSELIGIFWEAAHVVVRDLLLHGYRVVRLDTAGIPT